MTKWTADQISDQSGRTFIVTGANIGLGFETARELARHGGSVILAARNEAKGLHAVARIKAEQPRATVEYRALDLAGLAAVRAVAASIVGDGEPGAAATVRQSRSRLGLVRGVMTMGSFVLALSAAMGALDEIYGAVAPAAESGKLYGPDGFREMRGYPVQVEPDPAAKNEEVARRLWDISEKLTGVTWRLDKVSG